MPRRPPHNLYEKVFALSPRIDPTLHTTFHYIYEALKEFRNEARTRIVCVEVQPFFTHFLKLVLNRDPWQHTLKQANIGELLARSSQYVYDFYLNNNAKTKLGPQGEKQLCAQDKPFACLNCIPEPIAKVILEVQQTRNRLVHPQNGDFEVPTLAMAEWLLESMIVALEWHYTENPEGPGFASLYCAQWHYPHRKAGARPHGAPEFFGRVTELQDLYAACHKPEIRLINIIGRGGWGKTALLAALCEKLEREQVPCNLYEEESIGALLYLDCKRADEIGKIGASDWLTDKIFAYADDIFYQGGTLSALWKDPERDLRDKLKQLLHAMQDENCILVFDNFESALDENDHVMDTGLRCFFEVLLTTQSTIRVITTTRNKPIFGNRINERGQVYDKTLSAGLCEEDAIALLRNYGEGVACNEHLAGARQSQLRTIARLCYGIPQALVYVDTATNQEGISINQLLGDLALFGEEVVDKLCEDNYRRASAEKQFLLQVLSVFNRRIPEAGVEFVSRRLRPDLKIREALAWLKRARFVGRDSMRGDNVFSMHSLDQAYAYHRIPAEEIARFHEAVSDYYDGMLEEPHGGWWLEERNSPQTEEDEEKTEGTISSYLRFARYETATWQTLAADWFYHSGMAANRAKVRARLARRFFDAFWWWDEYETFDFCDKILERWHASQTDAEDRAFLRLIENFRAAYPKKWPLAGKRDRVEARRALQFLEEIRTWLGITDNLTTEDETHEALRALTESYLADLYGLEHSDPACETKARNSYRETRRLLQSIPGNYLWCQAYIWYEYAEFHHLTGQHQEALAIAGEAYTLIERRDGLSSHEPDMRVYRIAADAYNALGQKAQAWDCYMLCLWQAYCFHDNYQGVPQGPDGYTVLAHRHALQCVRARLGEWYQEDAAFALQCARNLHAFWRPLWQRQGSQDREIDDATLSRWLRAESETSGDFLAPAPPAIVRDREELMAYRLISEPIIAQITNEGQVSALMHRLPELHRGV